MTDSLKNTKIVLKKISTLPLPPACSQHCITTGARYRWHCDQTGIWVLVQVSSGVTHCVGSIFSQVCQVEISYGTFYINCPGNVSTPCPQSNYLKEFFVKTRIAVQYK